MGTFHLHLTLYHTRSYVDYQYIFLQADFFILNNGICPYLVPSGVSQSGTSLSGTSLKGRHIGIEENKVRAGPASEG